ncbi:neurochondrin homolog [Cimex lectularius]|uniref:Neurochondrin homolog n=1 Tax=Cimex lectularius TaxID=79782 RepID=A0A8I6S0J3_CIMLE|nr:neurochondrin homolog [Cimex lectularius]
MSDLPEPVQKCVAVLKNAAEDTDKLSALFLVTSVIKGGECSDAVKVALYEAIGVDFLTRMLNPVASGFSPDCPSPILRSLAMSIFSTFCTVEELADKPQMLARIPDFIKTVDEVDEEDELMTVSDAYECLKLFSNFSRGRDTLIKEGAIEKLIEVYCNQGFQSDEALKIVVILIEHHGPKTWENHSLEYFNTFVEKLASDFMTDHSERKFVLCNALHYIISSAASIPEIDKVDTWQGEIFKGVTDILGGKISKSQREPALHLASTMVQVFGMQWTSRDPEKPKQFFLLLTHLSSIEVRMQLEDRNISQIVPNIPIILSCFFIVECAVTSMGNDFIEMDSKEKQQIYIALKGAFTAVVNLLKKLHVKSSQTTAGINDVEKMLTTALIRVLASWMSQETSSLKEKIYELLPFILSVANESFYSYRAAYVAQKVKQSQGSSELVKPGKEEADLLRVLLPALCHITIDEKGRRIMLDNKEEEVLFENFGFHWSVVNYKKPVIPKSERLKQVKTQALELPENIKEAIKDSRVALVSMCNIFMNIIVLDPQFVETSSTFSSLLKFVLNNLTELKDLSDNIVLHANVAVLGLLLLKHQSKKVSKTDFSICRYIQSTIRFLWDAYHVDESDHMSDLVVSMAYKRFWIEVMEMWFLGMQTMSIVLSLIPWISEFIMETGWAQGTLDMLKRARPGSIPHNTKAAYEDFLCQLVKTNSTVIPIFKEHDALTVCRNHMFLALGKLLFGD